MKRAATVVFGIGLICGLIYLSWLNPTPVQFRLTPTWSLEGHVGALMMAAFMTGASLVLLLVSLGAARRAVLGWRSERRKRRSRRIDEWEHRGEQLVWQGEVQQGRALLQKAIQKRPEDVRTVLALAASYEDTGELHRARGALYDAANQHATDPEILFALAEIHRATGETGPYIESLERLRALYPRAPRALRALRDAYEQAQRWQDALPLQEALLEETRDPEGIVRERRRLLALRYQCALQIPDAKARLRALEGLADGRAPALPLMVSVGDALIESGQLDEASVLWERALRSTPRTILIERLASIASETKHRERLRSVLRKLRGDQVDTNALHLNVAKLFLQDADVESAARELEAVPKRSSLAAATQAAWTEVYQRRGQLEDALASALERRGEPAYHCQTCQRGSEQWTAFCPTCRDWDSYRALAEIGRG